MRREPHAAGKLRQHFGASCCSGSNSAISLLNPGSCHHPPTMPGSGQQAGPGRGAALFGRKGAGIFVASTYVLGSWVGDHARSGNQNGLSSARRRSNHGASECRTDLLHGTSAPNPAFLFLCSPPSCCHSPASNTGRTPLFTQSPAGSTVALVNGWWFTGQGFERRTGFSVKGRFTFKKPPQVDRTVDLADSFVVPPFGEAHNHNLGSAAEEKERTAVGRYLADGVFYVKIQGSPPISDAVRRRLSAGEPDSVDAVFAQGSITASGGHPIPLLEDVLLPRGAFPGYTKESLKGQYTSPLTGCRSGRELAGHPEAAARLREDDSAVLGGVRYSPNGSQVQRPEGTQSRPAGQDRGQGP